MLVKIGKKVYVDNLLNQPVVKTFNKARAGELPAEKIALYGGVAAAGIGIASMAVKNSKKPKLGVENGRLTEVPKTPNAVSSQTASRSKLVQAFPYIGDRQQSEKCLVGMLKGYQGVEIVQHEERYIHAVAKSNLLKFKDDIEFYFNDAKQQIEFRSQSRVGYSDNGVNRKRYEEMKNRYMSIASHNRR